MGGFAPIVVVLFYLVGLAFWLSIPILLWKILRQHPGRGPNLVACPDCDLPVSRRAATCPHCGCPLPPSAV